MATHQRERLDDGIEVLRLDRPQARNALDSAALAELDAALAQLAADESLRVLVLSTTSHRVVGAGAELAAACDLRVGGDNLRLAWPGARLGVPVGPARLTALVGLSAAKE